MIKYEVFISEKSDEIVPCKKEEKKYRIPTMFILFRKKIVFSITKLKLFSLLHMKTFNHYTRYYNPVIVISAPFEFIEISCY